MAILRFPDRRVPKREVDPEVEKQQIVALKDMLHTRRTQLRLFCDDFHALIEVCETKFTGRPFPAGLEEMGRRVRELRRWAHDAHASGHVPSDLRELEKAAVAIIAHAQDVSRLFSDFVKQGYAQALLQNAPEATIATLHSKKHGDTIERMLKAISELVATHGQ